MSDTINNNDRPNSERPKSSVVFADTSGTKHSSISGASGAEAVATGGPDLTPAPEGEKKKHTKLFIIIGIILALIIAAVGLGVWWFGGGGDDFYDNAAQGGQAPYKTEEEIQAELNRIVEEGMLNISIASVIEFENGTAPGVAYIENVPSNKYVMRVTITLDDTGEVVYQSGGIKPDSYIETITLSKDLDAGSYPATATFTAYDPDTLEEVGQAAAKISLSIAS